MDEEPSLDAVVHELRALIEGRITREEAVLWAARWKQGGHFPALELEPVINALAMADLGDTEKEHRYSRDDFVDMLRELTGEA